MNQIIISINPQYVNKIIKGIKKYEYRTQIPKKDINLLYIYETLPIKKVVAEVEVLGTLKMPPKALWELTKNYSGISKKNFNIYFLDKKIGYAYILGKVKIYDYPKDLNEFGIKAAPQSFVYLN